MSCWGHWCRAWVSTSSSQASKWVRGSVAREWERVIVEWVSDMLDGWMDGWMDGWVKTGLISTVDPKLIDQTLYENEC